MNKRIVIRVGAVMPSNVYGWSPPRGRDNKKLNILSTTIVFHFVPKLIAPFSHVFASVGVYNHESYNKRFK